MSDERYELEKAEAERIVGLPDDEFRALMNEAADRQDLARMVALERRRVGRRADK